MTGIRFGSNLKLHALAGAVVGFMTAVLGLVTAMAGGEVEAGLLGVTFTGLPAGVAGVLLWPALCALGGGIVAIPAHLVWLGLFRLVRGIELSIATDPA